MTAPAALGPAPKDSLLQIKPYVGGAAHTASGKTAVKLSSNENPMGPSPRARAAYLEAAQNLAMYPDGGAAALRAAIAKAEGLDPERLVCGAGSDELIALICKAYAGEGDAVLYSQYGFLMYKISALAAGAAPQTAPETRLRADVDALIRAAHAGTKLVFLANPNNPTGSHLSGAEIRRLREGLPPQALLVLDEAYAEYVTASDYESGLRLVEERDDVVVMRTFSKIHGLAALRLGWAYCPPGVADALNRARGPFNVSIPAQMAGAAAIQDREYIAACKAHNTRWRDWLAQALGGLGIESEPSQGNFLLLRFQEAGPKSAAAADAFLQGRGLILRRMEGYGLPDRLRLSIGRDEDNRAVVEALAEFMTDKNT